MSSQAEKLKIGLFMVVCLILAAGIVIWLGASRYFEDTKLAVAFFSESVQGLEKDSPVKFRGVTIGRVTDIQLAPDGDLIEVILSLNKSFKIREDLGIKITFMGLTGLKYLDMSTYASTVDKEPIKLTFTPEYEVIPTYPSDFQKAGDALSKLLSKIEDVDVAKMSYHLLRVSARLDKILSDPGFDNLGSDAASTMSEMKDSAKKLNQEITRVQRSKAIPRVLESTSQLMQQSTETVRSANRLISKTDNNISRLMRKLQISADNLREATRRWKESPLRTILGLSDAESKK